jgi:hypothetical protein
VPHEYRFSRRQFVGVGTAVLALAAARPTRSVSEGSLAPFRTIYDERFEAGRRFARDAADRGWITRAIRGDVTQVWFHELAVRWKRGPAAIAGLTTPQSLFVLERLAWDVGMRVTFRETHATHLVRWLVSSRNAEGPLL